MHRQLYNSTMFNSLDGSSYPFTFSGDKKRHLLPRPPTNEPDDSHNEVNMRKEGRTRHLETKLDRTKMDGFQGQKGVEESPSGETYQKDHAPCLTSIQLCASPYTTIPRNAPKRTF